jgi:inosine/xanthosine triphosphatase
MITVAVGSNNPAKLNAVEQAFKAAFQVEQVRLHGLVVESGVEAQPWGDARIREGARTRAAKALQVFSEAYAVGIESGVELIDDTLYDFTWVAIQKGTEVGYARSVAFPLPAIVHEHLKTGIELTEAMHRCFGIREAGANGGAIGHFTNSVIPRRMQIQPAIQCALIPFLHSAEYFPTG